MCNLTDFSEIKDQLPSGLEPPFLASKPMPSPRLLTLSHPLIIDRTWWFDFVVLWAKLLCHNGSTWANAHFLVPSVFYVSYNPERLKGLALSGPGHSACLEIRCKAPKLHFINHLIGPFIGERHLPESQRGTCARLCSWARVWEWTGNCERGVPALLPNASGPCPGLGPRLSLLHALLGQDLWRSCCLPMSETARAE